MNNAFLQQRIRHYVKLSKLDPPGQKNNEPDPDLTSAIIDLEEEILICFGLPPSANQYTSAMESYCRSDDNINQVADSLYRHLKNEAISYLTSPVKSNFEILIDGRERMLHANEVIPFTGYGTSSYNSFVYHDVFCRRRCSAADMIKAIRAGGYVNEFSADFSFVPYYSEFAEYTNAKQELRGTYPPDIDFRSPAFNAQYPIDSCLVVDSFVITAFSVYDDHTCIVEAAINYQGRLLKIDIWCTLKQLTYILRHSEYLSDTASVLLTLRHHNFTNRPYLFSSNGKATAAIYIINIGFQLERQGREAEVDDHTCSFIISYIPDHNSILRY